MTDLVAQQLRYVIDVVDVVVQLGQLLVRYGNQFRIFTGFVFHVQYTNRAGTDNRTRGNRVRRDNQHVQWVAVVSQSVRDVTVVGWVEHRRCHKAVYQQAIHVFVDFVFNRRMVGWDFDDHVNVIWQIFTGRNFRIAHG